MEELNDEKLRVSICRAVDGRRVPELWRVEVVTSVVLRGLRTLHGPLATLDTAGIAAAASLVMDIAGYRQAACAYRTFVKDGRRLATSARGRDQPVRPLSQ